MTTSVTLDNSVSIILSSSNTTTVKPIASEKLSVFVAEAEQLFCDFESSSEQDKDTLHKAKLIRALSQSYSELHSLCKDQQTLPSNLEYTAARLFYIYARCIYNESMEHTRQLLQLSLAIQCASTELLRRETLPPFLQHVENLEQLPKWLEANATFFDELNKTLMQSSLESLVQAACKQEGERPFTFALTVRWLGAPYQNLKKYQSQDHIPLFERIYGLASAIFKTINTQDSRWEDALIMYNAGRFMYFLKNPGKSRENIDAGLATLKPLAPIIEAENKSLRAGILQAQIYNITAVELGKVTFKDKEEETKLLEERIRLTSLSAKAALDAKGFNPFLTTLFLHNQATLSIKYLMMFPAKLESPLMEETAACFQLILKRMAEADYNHSYYPLFLINAAKFELLRKDLPKAAELLNKAEEISNRYKDDGEYEADQAAIAQLRTIFPKRTTAESADQKSAK